MPVKPGAKAKRNSRHDPRSFGYIDSAQDVAETWQTEEFVYSNPGTC
jgi:hypothetical protein